MRWNTLFSKRYTSELLVHLNLSTITNIVKIGCSWGELLLRAAVGSGVKATGVYTDLNNARDNMNWQFGDAIWITLGRSREWLATTVGRKSS